MKRLSGMQLKPHDTANSLRASLACEASMKGTKINSLAGNKLTPPSTESQARVAAKRQGQYMLASAKLTASMDFSRTVTRS